MTSQKWSLITAAAVAVSLLAGGATLSSSGLPDSPRGFGVAAASSQAATLSGSAASSGPTGWVSVPPKVTAPAGGVTQTQYAAPGGLTLSVVTPPVGFTPLTATAAQLAEYNFPARPSDAANLADWTTAMSDYRSDAAPTGALSVATSGSSTDMAAAVLTTRWAGYAAGTSNTSNHTFVGVKAVFKVPTISGAASCTASNWLGAWIGLGGTTSANQNDLFQQGVACGNSKVGTGSAFRPFTEFADKYFPTAFCGYSSWTIPAGHTVYQNMSYQTSSNTGYFFFEDETSGVTHSCSAKEPSGWGFNGNTAEWIVEGYSWNATANFGSVQFSDANAELSSNGSWVTLGSRSQIEYVMGPSTSRPCIAPGTISGGQTFTDVWDRTSC